MNAATKNDWSSKEEINFVVNNQNEKSQINESFFD